MDTDNSAAIDITVKNKKNKVSNGIISSTQELETFIGKHHLTVTYMFLVWDI